MPIGPFLLQWRTPSPNPPKGNALPSSIKRGYIPTPSGPLELLSALPSGTVNPSKPALFFQHGGFGCAEVWLEYMQYFSERGYPCYAVSLRGHGKSWYPSFLGLYFTSRGRMAEDLAAAIDYVERLETDRRGVLEERHADSNGIKLVLIAHSAGGALSNYALSRGLFRVKGFCMCAAVPAFGSVGVYRFWALQAPFHFPYRLFHPRYILATTRQVHAAFFTPSTPVSIVRRLESLLSPYETMLWPLQCLFRFVSGPDVLSSIVDWNWGAGEETASKPSRLFVLAAEHDVLCTPEICEDAALRYRAAFQELRAAREGISHSKSSEIGKNSARTHPSTQAEGQIDGDGVRFCIVPGLGHHLQNHLEWERGAVEIESWLSGL